MNAQAVADWLKTMTHIKDVRQVKVTINGKDYFGARYTRVGIYTADMLACTHRGVKPGTEYNEDILYLLGKRPKLKYRSCFPCEGFEWYFSGYYEGSEKNEAHPFGATFMVCPWTVAGKVDDGERHPYKRVPMTIQLL